jgi:hypothetical protein
MELMGNRKSVIRKSVAELMPHPILKHLAEIAEAEPSREQLAAALRAGRPVNLPVVHGNMVLFGARSVAVATAVGVKNLDVRSADGCDGLVSAEFALRAIAFHLQAAFDRAGTDPFSRRLTNARVYRMWAEVSPRRPPGRLSAEAKTARAATRATLIKRAFGRSQRSMERDCALLDLPALLQDAVRTRRLPEKYGEPAARLSGAERRSLGSLLGGGTPFVDIAEDFFEASGRRKTAYGVNNAIRTAIHAIAIEASGRANTFALRREGYPAAEEASRYLAGWLAAPPPTATLDQVVEEAFRGFAPIRGAKIATGGGRGAAKGRP